jgi:hypothetical protein
VSVRLRLLLLNAIEANAEQRRVPARTRRACIGLPKLKEQGTRSKYRLDENSIRYAVVPQCETVMDFLLGAFRNSSLPDRLAVLREPMPEQAGKQ